MDLDGVHAQVIYGPPMGFKMGEAGFKTACLRAYNDWGAEFNGHDRGRPLPARLSPHGVAGGRRRRA